MPTVLVENFNQTSFHIKGEKTLFDELEEQGLELPHGCLSGSCSACKVFVTRLEGELSPIDPIEANTLDSIKNLDSKFILRLSCRAKLTAGSLSIKTY